MSDPQRRLYLLRHAKSDWDAGADSDFLRPLNRRGRETAPRMGEWLGDHGIRPEAVYASPAERARQTILLAAAGLAVDPVGIVWDNRLYLAGTRELLAIVRELPARLQRVMLVGHNPGLEELLAWLLPESPEPDPGGKLLPTMACAEIALDSGWETIEPGSGALVQLARPKQALTG